MLQGGDARPQAVEEVIAVGFGRGRHGLEVGPRGLLDEAVSDVDVGGRPTRPNPFKVIDAWFAYAPVKNNPEDAAKEKGSYDIVFKAMGRAINKTVTNVELIKDLSPPGTCDPLCSVDETSSEAFEANYQPKPDLIKALAILAAAGTRTLAINHSWVAANQDLAMALLFGIGYAGIIFEESLALNKSGVGLLMAVALWELLSYEGGRSEDIGKQKAKVAELSKFGRLAKMQSSSWWIRFFIQSNLEGNESAIKKFEQAAAKKSYVFVCQVLHRKPLL
ncbi:uncharacterized protein at3g49720 [Phtheirospermum japonicum]|uniref:Uncharacterized protein at3g49720 n=1 Tax=Phtheirospermum japonicum TaxID=374723 RepID=A0A830DPR9_9LAMI|nr:uncharacterized protein at3g49720 [Phtheirospermum japonicum]